MHIYSSLYSANEQFPRRRSIRFPTFAVFVRFILLFFQSHKTNEYTQQLQKEERVEEAER